VRFLIDTNLPKALCAWLVAKGYQAEHVLDIGLAQSKDSEIWRHASESGAIVVSKDEDFADLARQPKPGPAVVWMRTGNGTTRSVLRLLDTLWPVIEARLAAGDRLVEVR
jgi:predicted nuclease of predicted toxin-antitoxin system